MLQDKGYVLRAPRSATSNFKTTDEAESGVTQDYRALDSTKYKLPSPELVSLAEDQYRVSTLLRQENQEFLIWAANTSSIRSSVQVVSNPEDIILSGSLDVIQVIPDPDPNNPFTQATEGILTDGSLQMILNTSEGQIAEVLTISARRGDTGATVNITPEFTFDSRLSKVTLTNQSQIALLGGGLSRERGDSVSATVRLSGPQFWWTKNDSIIRFGWIPRLNRWAPFRGAAPSDLGALLSDETYQVSPFPSVSIGQTLPGDPNFPGQYAQIRVGREPNESSIPVRTVVKAEVEFEANEDAVLLPDGTLTFNPDFILQWAGETIWYAYEQYRDIQDSVGLFGQSLYISPVPRIGEMPFIKIGSRTPLTAFLVPNETDLALLNLEEGQVGVSLSTGKLAFSQVDLDKINPDSPFFDVGYLGAEVFYDGVALSQSPVSLRTPAPLLGEGGLPQVVSTKNSLFITSAVEAPYPGISGILNQRDKTGREPNSLVAPATRPNGSGLVKSLSAPGDLVLFGQTGQIRDLVIVESEEDVPRYRFRIPRGKAYINLQTGEVSLGKEDRKVFANQQMYLSQASVSPSFYVSEAIIPSFLFGDISLEGNEIFRFRINSQEYEWNAASNPGGLNTSEGGTFSNQEIANSLDSLVTDGDVVSIRNQIFIRSGIVLNQKRYGEIEIGYGPDGDLKANSAFGFLPGWYVRISSNPLDPVPNSPWLPCNGTSLGIFRSPLNLDGTQGTPDLKNKGEYDDVVMFDSVPSNSVILLQRSPLEDFPGYDHNVFFQAQVGLETRLLEPFQDLVGDFSRGRFLWADQTKQSGEISRPILEIPLQRIPAFPLSFEIPSQGLRVSLSGQDYERYELEENFVIENNSILFVEKVGSFVSSGALGSLNGNIFSDSRADFSSVLPGYQLDIIGGISEGTYIVQEVFSPISLRVSPGFIEDAQNQIWELFEGKSSDEVDSGIVADVQYEEFNHLPEDPFRVRLLSPLGTMPLGTSDQNVNRRVAILGDALNSQREFNVRVGEASSSPTLSPRPLQKVSLGNLVNGLILPLDVNSERFINEDFSLLIGSVSYTFQNLKLVKVPNFTEDLTSNVVEIRIFDGALQFGQEVFTLLESQEVRYIEEFLDPDQSGTELPQGVFEYNPVTGKLNFSIFDMTEYGGTDIFFVELMNTSAGDLVVNPLQGSFLFDKPLRESQKVEAEYFLAQNGTGEILLTENEQGELVPTRIIEFLSRRIDLELAIYQGDFRWLFNEENLTVDLSLEPAVYIGSTLTNVGSSPVSFIEGNQIIFEAPVTQDREVKISYWVFEADGGEQTFTTSQNPIYRPPFRIPEGRTNFGLEGQRMDLEIGQLLRVAQFPFYITGIEYLASQDTTIVTFIPETVVEAGSRDPSLGSLSLLSDKPLALDLSNAASAGFWLDITIPFEPFNRGKQEIIFEGDVTSVAVTGHILELAGLPFIISGSTIIDNSRTLVDITGVFPRGFNSEQDSVRISVRPIYPTNSTTFVGRGALLANRPFELLKFPSDSPGEKLILDLDYTLDFDTGDIELSEPLSLGESLYLRQTKRDLIAPSLINEVTIDPRVIAEYIYQTRPSEENGLLGVPLRAKYLFDNPDSFYYQALLLQDYLGEVAQEVSATTEASLPSSGPPSVGFPTINNSNQGRLGLLGDISNFYDQDRSARVFIEFYDQTIQSFEQIVESITGQVIGDRDGKFRFFVGREDSFVSPGYEDEITGRLNNRNIFSELWFAQNRDIILESTDPLVDPLDAELVDGEVEGKFIDPDLLDSLIEEQTSLVRNDIDDIVLTSRSRKKLRLFPLRLEAFGNYRKLGVPSELSRIFPQRTEAFTLLDPGIGSDLEENPVDPGVYAFSRYVNRPQVNGTNITLPKRASTFNKEIGDISNPVIGVISNISSIFPEERRARAVVFKYSPVGFPAFDAQIASEGGITFTSNPRPAVIATPLRLKDFPIAENTFPDIQQLAAQGGDVIDLSTGDPDLFTPAWKVLDPDQNSYPKILFGKPDGREIEVTNGQKTSFEFPPTVNRDYFESLYVGEVLLGCIITFVDQQGNTITSPQQIQQLAADPQETSGVFLPQPGDTIFIGPSDINVFSGLIPNDPVTQSQRLALTSGLPDYRTGFDIKIDRKDGKYKDMSAPSFFDPSPLGIKEIFGQKPPLPLSTIEAEVTFTNTAINLIQIPALLGLDLNDSGDRSIPYIATSDSELNLLGQAQGELQKIFIDSAEPGAVYPDEIEGTDGEILEGAMTTSRDLLPGYSLGSGTMNTRPFDFLFFETNQGVPEAMQGMLSVGSVSNNQVSLPRFISPSVLGDRIRYIFENAIGFVNNPLQPNPPGMVVSRVGNITTFDITSISTAFIVFNDGTPAIASGGLNDIIDPGGLLTYPNNANIIRLNLFDPTLDTFLQTIEINVNSGVPEVTGDLGTQGLLSIPSFTDNVISLETAAAFVTIGVGGLPEDVNNPGQSEPLEFTISIDTSDIGGGSFTGRIEKDRLTFQEGFDLKSTPTRDIPPIGGFPVNGSLEIISVTGAGTELLTINNATEVNGGDAFTFWFAGEFESGVGRISVPGFEGFNNTTISESDVIFSALPSSNWDEDQIIAQGTGIAESSLSADDTDFRIANVSTGLDRVLPGDVLVIQTDDVGQATTKAGTYLVKHAIDPNVGNYRSIDMETLTLPANTGVGFFQPVFPKLISFDLNSATLTLSSTTLSDGSSAWAPTGLIYFVLDAADLSQTISLEYLAVDNNANTITFLQGSGQSTSGANISDDVFANLPSGTLITGFSYGEIDFTGTVEENLPRSLVGNLGDGTVAFAGGGTGFGFRTIEISNIGSEIFTYEIAPAAANNLVVGAPGLDQLGIDSLAPISSLTFVSDPNAIVYENVAFKLDFTGISTLQWQNIHGVLNLSGIFPGDVFTANDFRAQGGIFLEPSVPRPVLDYTGTNAKVVDAGHTLNVNQIGFRDGPFFGAIVTPEQISFEVRRIRRFHETLTSIQQILEPLRYLYEKRTGTVLGFGPKVVGPNQELWPYVLEADGTNLGVFDDPKVNINPNDLFRLLDSNGDLIDEVEIVAVDDANNLLLRKSLQDLNPVGKSFEVYIKKAPVPHEQSYDELLDQVTDDRVLSVRANYINQTGGQVPVEQNPFDPRKLLDSSRNFLELGVLEGDIIIIDPAGEVRGPQANLGEKGSRPFGDRSVPERTLAEVGQEIPFQAGSPSEFDDNRGWYRVTKVEPTLLTVSSETSYSSNPGEGNVIFGDNLLYTVYPTVSGSLAPFASPPGGPGVEGQMDLRPTALAGEAGSPVNSFSGNLFSIAPFSYSIIRPSPLFTEETIDLILLGRERTKSWIEEFETFFAGNKSGNYFLFQKEEHISDLGNPLIPEEGLGIISNELVNNIRGEINISPFANTTDGLSVLDRRYWINDERLDQEFPPNQINVPAYANLEEGDGRPVLTDRIDEALNTRDSFREKRYFWLDFRVNREQGTLTQIEISEKEFLKRKQKLVQRLVISESLGDV